MEVKPIDVQLPHRYKARPYQANLFSEFFATQKKRFLVYWHRRAGKDKTYFQIAVAATQEAPGAYWYMLPKATQARKAIWKGRGKDGVRFLDHIPPEIIKSINNTEMYVEFTNGSLLYVLGSDSYDNLVGNNPLGVVFSEWPLCDPRSWDYIRPILAENGGWAMFCGTPRGKNHGYTMLKNASKLKDRWYVSVLTANDTVDNEGNPIITPEIIQNERDEGMSEDMIQQEYFCSFEALLPGLVYKDELRAAIEQNRITNVPIDPTLPINTAWDLGYNDQTSIWFWQAVGNEIRLVDYHQDNRKSVQHYCNNVIKTWAIKHGCRYETGRHLGPHDCEKHDMNGKTAQMYAAECGIRMERTARPHRKRDGLAAVRKLWYRIWIDDSREGSQLGYACLSSYHREKDEEKDTFKDEPVHDWSSHGADALQTLALGFNESMAGGFKPAQTGQAQTDWDPFD